MKTAVVALGGNAIIQRGEKTSIAKQFARVAQSLRCIVPLLKRGYAVIITHGNGPQVGNILIRVEEALGKAYRLPLEVCVAESQGEMGYMIEQCLLNMLQKQNIRRMVASILTQVVVDSNDPHFHKPTKPVGPFLNMKHAMILTKAGQHVVRVDGAYRRVVPSPRPLAIVEASIIKQLIENKVVVIAAGGGGIPVYKKKGKLEGIAAVIDKDLSSYCLAKAVKADLLLILTDVDNAYLDYGKRKQRPLRTVSIAQAKQYLQQGHFPPGSMGPKIEAALLFASTGGKAIITSPEKVEQALKGKAGTTIQ